MFLYEKHGFAEDCWSVWRQFSSGEYLSRQIGNLSAWKYNVLTNEHSDSWNHISRI